MANSNVPAPKRKNPTARHPVRSWEDVITSEREDMSWEDIFDIYRLEQQPACVGTVKLRGVGPTPHAEALECKRCGEKFFSSHYFGATPLCYAHRGGKG